MISLIKNAYGFCLIYDRNTLLWFPLIWIPCIWLLFFDFEVRFVLSFDILKPASEDNLYTPGFNGNFDPCVRRRFFSYDQTNTW